MSRLLSLAGLILVVLLWSTVLLSPDMRVLLRDQISGLSSYNALNSDRGLGQVMASHPNDPRVLALNIDFAADRDVKQALKANEAVLRADENTLYKIHVSKMRRYDALIEKFPSEAWLIQSRLRLAAYGGFGFDIGEFDSPEYRSRPKPQPWLSRAELIQSLKIAERGARLEPQNSFYDWMRAMFLFALKRNEAALVVLHAGSLKSNFDDGVMQDVRNRIAVRELQSTPLLWEDRLMTAYSELLPHFAPIRSACRTAVWQGALAERRGDHVRALQIYEDQWKLGRLIRRTSKIPISLLVGRSIMAVAWGGYTRRLSQAETNTGQEEMLDKMRLLASRFATYARQHGSPDLASEAERDAQVFDVTYEYGKGPNAFYVLASGKDAREIFRWKWAGVICLHAILWCGATWFVLTGLHWLRNKLKAKEGKIILSNTDIIAAALFVAIPLGVIAIIIWRLIDLQTLENWALFGDIDAGMYATEDARNRSLVPIFKRWLPFAPLTLVLFYSVITALWRGRKEPGAAGTMSQAGCVISAFIFLVVSGGTAFLIIQQILLAQRLNLDAWAIRNWLVLFTPVLGIVGLLIYLVVRFGRTWFTTLYRALQWIDHTHLLTRTLPLLIVIFSCVYFMTSLLALPVRREASARLNECLTRGEVAILREAAGRSGQ